MEGGSEDSVKTGWKKETEARTSLIASFFSWLAMASNCASWLNRSVEMGVTRFAIDLIGFGFAVNAGLGENESAPYTLTKPEVELSEK